MLSKKELLKSIMGKKIYINPYVENGCIDIIKFQADYGLCYEVAEVGDDVFQVIFYNTGGKVGKTYYSIGHIAQISGDI